MLAPRVELVARAIRTRPGSVRVAALGSWGLGVAILVWRRGIPFEREQVIAVCLAGLGAAGVGARGAWRQLVRDWLPIVVALAAYDYTRGAAGLLGRPVLVRWPADMDRALFGDVPTVWFQANVEVRSWLAVSLSLVYASHFVVPFAVAAYLWWRDRELWVRWRRRFLTVTSAALLVFLAQPVAPPWVASRVGVIDTVTRSAGEGWSLLGFRIAEDVISHGQATTNLYAALPSLHAAFALVTVLAVWGLLSRAGRVAVLAYPVAMGVTLVATGEHYVVDIAAGAGLVVIVEFAWRRSEVRHPGSSRPARTETEDAAVGARRLVPPWFAPIAIPVVVALATRAWRLGIPSVLTYDEVFYVNDAADLAFVGHQDGALHPPLGKLLMAPAIGLFGFEPLVWRAPVLLAGAVVVALTGASAWLATHSRRLTALVALLVALDGLAFVTGRLGLLEGAAAVCVAMALFALTAVHCPGGWADTGRYGWAPVAAVGAAGAGVAAKWALVPAALVTVGFLVGPMRSRWQLHTSTAVATAVAGSTAAMVLAWGPAACSGTSCLVAPATSLLTITSDSVEMASFHRSLERDGPGHAPAWTWVVQSRPTVLYEKECRGQPGLTDGVCQWGATGTSRVVAAGNPALWLAGTAALAVTGWRSRRRPTARRAAVAVALAGSLWVPWLAPGARPYSFYGAVLVPPLALAVAQVLDGRRWRVPASVALGCLAVAWFVYRYPDLTALG